MLDSAAYFNFPDLMLGFSVVDTSVREVPRAFSQMLVEASDGYLVVAPASGAHVAGVCAAVGHPEWRDELRPLGTGPEFRAELVSRIQTETRRRSAVECVRIFREMDVPAAEVLTPDQHFEHPQVRHNETYREVDSDELGRYRYPAYPARFDRPLPDRSTLP
jgi:crotonobetainyl-CoA:carnitine CoA-transferase CaiB-like acyl-CoA transferase